MVLVGDTGVGKSCLITSYLSNTFTHLYEPTVLDCYKGEKTIPSKHGGEVGVKVEIHDTAGDDHLGGKRKFTYKGTDIFIICVAVNNENSF